MLLVLLEEDITFDGESKTEDSTGLLVDIEMLHKGNVVLPAHPASDFARLKTSLSFCPDNGVAWSESCSATVIEFVLAAVDVRLFDEIAASRDKIASSPFVSKRNA